ncbi:nuclear transport factor 2 family protein [Candidatus Borrarchaeum sp.]|uniref:nuclear transport factor 2 family protein n=1 Tax=Candidatus Borrarchaeum sp. TaxID=2846742 RepID=UPI002579463A|nr:nuclear transport factor 2 family protein [Candidatus Borrarchaeum sp.]
MTTEEILKHHLESFGTGNVDEIVKDYTEDSVIFTPDKVVKGLSEIRALFKMFTTELLPPGCDFKLLQQQIQENVAYIAWNAESESHKFYIGTDTFVIKDGKIGLQTFAAHVEKK